VPRAAGHAAAGEDSLGKRALECFSPAATKIARFAPFPDALVPEQRNLASHALYLSGADGADEADGVDVVAEQSEHVCVPDVHHIADSRQTAANRDDEELLVALWRAGAFIPVDDAAGSHQRSLLMSPQEQGRPRDQKNQCAPPPPQQDARAVQQNARPAKRAAEQVLHRDGTDDHAQFYGDDAAPPAALCALEHEGGHFSLEGDHLSENFGGTQAPESEKFRPAPADERHSEGGQDARCFQHVMHMKSMLTTVKTGLSGEDGDVSATKIRANDEAVELADGRENHRYARSPQSVEGACKDDSTKQSQGTAATATLLKLSAANTTASQTDEGGLGKQHTARMPLSVVRDNGQGERVALQEVHPSTTSAIPNGYRRLQKEKSRKKQQAGHAVGLMGSHVRDDVSSRARDHEFKKKYLALMGGGGDAISYDRLSSVFTRSTVSGSSFRLCSSLCQSTCQHILFVIDVCSVACTLQCYSAS
jgi:hypothetical protein